MTRRSEHCGGLVACARRGLSVEQLDLTKVDEMVRSAFARRRESAPVTPRSSMPSARRTPEQELAVSSVLRRPFDKDYAAYCSRRRICRPARASPEPRAAGGRSAFLTYERLKMCWDQVAQIGDLVRQAYVRPTKADLSEVDAHPMQYAVPLFTFALRLACFYREPNLWHGVWPHVW